MNKWKLTRAKGTLQDSQEKRDEVRAISAFAGMILGSAIGIPISIALGLLIQPGTRPPFYDWITNLIIDLSFFSFSIIFGCLIAFQLPFTWRKEPGFKIHLPLLSSLSVLFIWLFLSMVMTFIYGPLNDFLLQYLTPFSVFSYGALVFFPFMIMMVYILLPSLRPRIRHQLGLLVTRKFWSDIRKNPKRHRRMLFLTTALVIIIIVDILRAIYT